MDRARQPLLPDYEGACLAGVVPALLAPPGQRPAWVPVAAAEATQVVLLVLDGLGWAQLQDRLGLVPTLAAMAGGPITSVVPTTTATALTSIVFGAAPAEHGVVGYRLRVEGPTGEEVLNVLRWRTASGGAEGFVPPAGFARGSAFRSRAVPVVTRSDFEGTGFSVAHLAGAPLCLWHTASGIAVGVRHALAAGASLVYAYYDGVDKVAHGTGLGEHYEAELAYADRVVADVAAVLPPGAALVVTADHGQVDVGRRASPIDPSVLAGVRLVSGEGRFRWLHARPGAEADVLAAASERYGAEAWVRTVDQLDADGWFGGALGPVARARLGDVAVVPWEPVAYLDAADGADARLVSRHGSLTEAEMLVPLLATAG